MCWYEDVSKRGITSEYIDAGMPTSIPISQKSDSSDGDNRGVGPRHEKKLESRSWAKKVGMQKGSDEPR